MNLIKNPEVEIVFKNYPKGVQQKLLRLRKLILETADEIDNIDELEETLKWGEPSYLAKKGSTIRIDWKKSNPDQYAMYFKCTSKLVETFKIVYGDLFKYEGTRAIVFKIKDKVPVAELKHCIALALRYHHVKNLPLLGADVK
jgi:uncharacterized protein DUF1801